MSDLMLPTIVCSIDGHEHATTLLSYDFAKNRRIQLRGAIDDMTAYSISAQIRYLSEKASDPIILDINSPGGSVTAGMEIFDAMNATPCELHTVASGLAASMGAFLLAAGTPGKRYITPSAEVLIHQPLGGAQGQATDILIQAKHIERIREHMNQILAHETGQPIEKIRADTDRDTYMTANEAVEYGIVDIIGSPKFF